MYSTPKMGPYGNVFLIFNFNLNFYSQLACNTVEDESSEGNELIIHQNAHDSPAETSASKTNLDVRLS